MPLTIASEWGTIWYVVNGWGDVCHAASTLDDAVEHVVHYIDNMSRLGLPLRWAD